MPVTYRQAQLRARAAAGSLTAAAARRVLASIEAYAEQLAGQVALLSADTPAARRAALEQAAGIARRASAQLRERLTAAVREQRTVAFSEILALWREAGETMARAQGIPNALLGGIAAPDLRMAGAFESLGGVSYLKSLARSTTDAHAEVHAIIRTGLVSNVSPQELAKRLRPYVAGAEEFEAVFPKRDERFAALHDLRDRQLSPELRNAAFKVRSNSLRIAYSEIHNARAEAELNAFAVDPVVAAVKWSLSPFRGSQASPDVCDGLASNDFYGLGPGVYPLDAVPLSPHPRDRCERVPVMRDPKHWHEPKPRELRRLLDPSRARVTGGPDAPRITAAEQERIRRHLRAALVATDNHRAQASMRALMTEGEQRALELVRERATRPPPPAPPRPERLPGWNGPTGAFLRERFASLEQKTERLVARINDELSTVEAARRRVEAEVLSGSEFTRLADLRSALARERARMNAHLARRYGEAWLRKTDEVRNLAIEMQSSVIALRTEMSRFEMAAIHRSATVARLATREVRLRKRLKNASVMRDRAVAQLLRSDTLNTSHVEFAEEFDAERRARYERGIQRWRELWGDRAPASARFFIRAREGPYAQGIGLEGTTRAVWVEAIRTAFLDPLNGADTIAHELSHGVELSVRAIYERAVAFRQRRTVGERLVALKKLYPEYNYDPSERTLADRFDELNGRGSAYAGKVYPYPSTEIITMGVEWLISRPLDFARRDPEFFDFIIETLWGAW